MGQEEGAGRGWTAEQARQQPVRHTDAGSGSVIHAALGGCVAARHSEQRPPRRRARTSASAAHQRQRGG